MLYYVAMLATDAMLATEIYLNGHKRSNSRLCHHLLLEKKFEFIASKVFSIVRSALHRC